MRYDPYGSLGVKVLMIGRMNTAFWYEDLKGIMIRSWDSDGGNSENSILMCDTAFFCRHLLTFLSPSSPSTTDTSCSGDYKGLYPPGYETVFWKKFTKVFGISVAATFNAEEAPASSEWDKLLP